MVLDVLRQHCLIWYVLLCMMLALGHDDVIRWKHFPRYWPFVKGIHPPPVDSFHKGHWRGTLMFSLICAWTNGLANNRDDGQLRRRHAHYDITVCYVHQHKPISCKLSEFAVGICLNEDMMVSANVINGPCIGVMIPSLYSKNEG